MGRHLGTVEKKLKVLPALTGMILPDLMVVGYVPVIDLCFEIRLDLAYNVQVMKMIGSFFLDIIETLVVALSIFLIVYLFVMQPHQVNGQSMHPNFIDGEYLLTDKITYRFRQPERGEVVVFHAPEATQCPEGTGCDFIKRVIGLPGETIYVNDNKLFVDGEALEEPYIPEDYVTRAGAYTLNGPITIGDNSYFVVGDNRSHSSDSRAWGPVQVEQIVGKVFFRYWPPQEIGTVAEVAY